VTRLNIEMVKALNASDVRSKLEDNGMTVIGGTPEQFGALMQDGIVRYGAIIKATGIQAE
jgi:tripartite-type tricarboxylate transporter receptor subunit TctC